MEENYGIKPREKDFYERNIGKDVDLVKNDSTISGTLKKYDRDRGVAELTDVIWRNYNSDNSSSFGEFKGDLEIDVTPFFIKKESSLEDRLGRIAKYNEDLEIETLERNKKLKELREFNLNIKKPNN